MVATTVKNKDTYPSIILLCAVLSNELTLFPTDSSFCTTWSHLWKYENPCMIHMSVLVETITTVSHVPNKNS